MRMRVTECHGPMAAISSKASDEIMQEVSRKRQIAGAKKLFELTGQAPSPSKDYLQVLVTEGGVVLRRVPITVRGVTQGAVPAPSEKVLTLEEFAVDADFQAEVGRTFGTEALKQVKKAASGKWDVFLRLGEDLLIAIVSLLDLQSIARLSCVNQHLRETCNCDRLWELLYRTHQGHPSEEIGSLAAELGWKTVFFMNKLQLQKELSRRRREKLGDIESQASDFTFLTES